MFFSQRALHVNGRQQGEDVRLQDLDEEFEEGHDDCHHEGDGRRRHKPATGLKQGNAAEDEDQQDHVSSEHVRKKPDRQRDWPQHQVRQELDGDDDRIHQDGGARWDTACLEVTEEAVLFDTDRVVDKPRKHAQDGRESDVGVRRDLHHGHDRQHVRQRDKTEKRREVRGKADPLRAHNLFGDTIADEPIERFSDPLFLRRHELRIAIREHEETDDQTDREEYAEGDRGQRAFGQSGNPVAVFEVLDTRGEFRRVYRGSSSHRCRPSPWFLIFGLS